VDPLLSNDSVNNGLRQVMASKFPNTHQWSNWEAVFSTHYVRQLRNATIKLLEEMISMRSVPRCNKQDKSRVQIVVRELPASRGVNTEVEEVTVLVAVTW
jgi:hypothetical protein